MAEGPLEGLAVVGLVVEGLTVVGLLEGVAVGLSVTGTQTNLTETKSPTAQSIAPRSMETTFPFDTITAPSAVLASSLNVIPGLVSDIKESSPWF